MTRIRTSSKPLFSLIALGLFLGAVVVALVLDRAAHPNFWTIVGTSVPSLIAAIAGETAARDIRNGVVMDKARQGARQAIEEAQVVTRTGPVVSAELQALTNILAAVHSTTASTNEKVDAVADAVAAQDVVSGGDRQTEPTGG